MADTDERPLLGDLRRGFRRLRLWAADAAKRMVSSSRGLDALELSRDVFPP